MLTLHWSPKSPYVRKVMIVAHELDLLPRLQLVRSVAAMLKPNERLMVDNPLSKIPTLVMDDGSTLFDSVVICEYLNDLGQGPLFPREGWARWQSLRWHAFGDGLLEALILWRNERERSDAMRSHILIDAFDLKVRAALHQLEKEVPDLEAAPFNIGHLTLACALSYLDFRFDMLGWRGITPKLGAWYDVLKSRPSIATTEPQLEG